MSLLERHAHHVAEFHRRTSRAIVEQVTRDDYGVVLMLEIAEDEQGIWAEVTIALRGEVVRRWGAAVYTRRDLIISAESTPDDDPEFGSALFARAVEEDLVTCGRHG